MSSSSSRSGEPIGSDHDIELKHALAVGLAVSVLVHAALLLVPPVEVRLPDHLEPRGRLTLLPPPEEPPPEVEVPAPPEPIGRPAEPRVATGGDPVPVESEGPAFIPHDVPPRLLNSDEVQQYLRLFYPMALRVASVEGSVHLWLYVNESGQATKLQVRQSSGSPKFDRLARSAAPLMEFRPALNQGRTVGVWVSLWVRFDLLEPELEGAEAERVAGGVAGDGA